MAPLIGRDAEVATVLERLRTPGLRLVTICGLSGVGKSAVAAVALARVASEDPVGITAVHLDLGGGAGPDTVRAALAAVSGTAGTGTGDIDATPPPGRTRLVLLDGLEAVEDGAGAVAAALQADPDLTVLVTSVVPLALREEHVIRLEPLAVPPDGVTDPAKLLESPALQLVVRRIEDATPSPSLGDGRLARLAGLCRALDGLPLALELAAYRCGSLGVDVVLDQIERRSPLTVLTSGPVDVAEHHRSLRATLQWTYDLLDEGAQRLLRRLAVFVGSFDWDAMEEVAVDPGTSAEGLADHLSALLDAGLVRAVGHGTAGAAPRFTLSPSASRFAHDRLEEEGSLDEVRDRHTRHYRSLARWAWPRFWTPQRHATVVRLRPEMIEFATVVRRLGEQDDRIATLRMTVDLMPLWTERAAAGEGAHLLAAALDEGQGELPDDLRCGVWACAVHMKVWGQPVRGLTLDLTREIDEMLERATTVGPETSWIVLEAAVQELILAGDNARARELAERGSDEVTAAGDRWWLARFLVWQAIATGFEGRTDEALELGVRSRDAAASVGDDWQVLRTTHVLANSPGARDSGIPLPDDKDLIRLAVRLDDPQTEGMVRLGAAYTALSVGDLLGTAEQLRHALDLARRDGFWFLEELALFVLVIACAGTGQARTAARLHGALRSALGDPTKVLPPEYVAIYDMLVDGLLASLGDDEFQAEVTGGELLGWSEALRVADGVVAEFGGDGRTDAVEPAGLSPREREILALIAQGSSNKEIAVALGLRPKTVMHHSSSIYRKLGVRGRAEAVTTAFRNGLLDGPRPAGRSA